MPSGSRPVSPTNLDAEEQRLIESLLAEDEAALAEVRKWVRGAVTPYRARLAADIEDLEQETLLELLDALRDGRFEGRSRLSTYVRRMVHYKCLHRLRAISARPQVELPLELVDARPTPFDRSARRQEREASLLALSRTPESCRELWQMIAAGLSYREMGERLDVAAGTLRVRVLRCRQRALAERDRILGSAGP